MSQHRAASFWRQKLAPLTLHHELARQTQWHCTQRSSRTPTTAAKLQPGRRLNLGCRRLNLAVIMRLIHHEDMHHNSEFQGPPQQEEGFRQLPPPPMTDCQLSRLAYYQNTCHAFTVALVSGKRPETQPTHNETRNNQSSSAPSTPATIFIHHPHSTHHWPQEGT